jgi:hypothetical protein
MTRLMKRNVVNIITRNLNLATRTRDKWGGTDGDRASCFGFAGPAPDRAGRGIRSLPHPCLARACPVGPFSRGTQETTL